MIRVDLVAGARPNFMKAGPLYTELKRSGEFSPRFVATGQHSIEEMSSRHYKVVGLPSPDVQLYNPRRQFGLDNISRMIKSYDEVLNSKEVPDWIVVFGDTDSSLVGAYVAKRHNVKLAHVEALVFGDPNEPEEYHRRMIDSISDLLLTPYNVDYPLKPFIKGEVVCVGNIMIDALKKVLASKDYRNFDYPKCDLLVTMHRPSNVDNKETLREWIECFDEIAEEFDLVFVMHPRTYKRCKEYGIGYRKYMYGAMDYDKFVKTMENTKVVITDSGGMLPEAVYLGRQVVSLRNRIGWGHLEESGDVVLCPTPDDLTNAILSMRSKKHEVKYTRYWRGTSSYKIKKAILNYERSI